MTRGRTPLTHRYSDADLEVFGAEEARRFLGSSEEGAGHPPELPALVRWELLYRLEPELYHRLVSAEPLHPAILAWLPRCRSAIEVGAGTGRLTVELATRSDRLTAVEPAAPLRVILARRLAALGIRNTTLAAGYFDRIPAPDGGAELVIACSALTANPAHGGDPGLAEMERVCRPGGQVVIVWPTRPDWLTGHGYSHLAFDGQMAMEFESLDEAVELATIFFPQAVAAIEARGDARVPYEVIGNNPPCDIAWKRLPE